MKNTFNLKSFLHFLSRNKLYTAINIFGFSISLAVVILLGCYTARELSVDQFHEKKDRIFRLSSEDNACFACLIGADLQNRYPEIEKYTYYGVDEEISTINGDKFLTKIARVDSTFFDIFSFRLIEGTPCDVLCGKNSVVVSEQFARKVFGNESPVGKSIESQEEVLTVSGVVADFGNSTFPTSDIITSIQLVGPFYLTQYGANRFELYLLIREHVSLHEKLPDMLEFFKGYFWLYQSGRWKEIHLQPFPEVYFKNEIEEHNVGSKTRITILASVSLLILLFAVINYINLTVAQAGTRAKEMATRRLLGSTWGELFTRLILESILLCLVSSGLGLLFAASAESMFNNVLKTKISVGESLTGANILLGALGVVGLGIIAGVGPAVLMSGHKPIEAVRGVFGRRTKQYYSKLFITFQYVITIVLIGSTIVMTRQTDHLLHADMGFRPAQIILLDNVFGDRKRCETLRTELMKVPGVELVSLTQGVPTDGGNNNTDTNDPNRIMSYQCFGGDSLYMQLMGFEILRDNQTSDNRAVWLNEAALRKLELPIDAKEFTHFNQKMPIAGVVKDFNFKNMTKEVGAALVEVYNTEDWDPWDIAVKVSGDDLAGVYQRVGVVCEQHSEGIPFQGKFMEADIQEWYEEYTQTAQIIGYFSVIAILIATLGILAMATYYVQQRTQEIGVRQVFGSTKGELLRRLVMYFMRWVVVAFLIATPITYLLMREWLSAFISRIPLSPLIFLAAGAGAALIALLAVSWQSWRAANSNPVETLKR